MRIVIIAFVSCLAIVPAKAEFVMLSQPSGGAALWPSPPTPTKAKAGPKRHQAAVAEPVLTGFGDRIPLMFAVRQIVPAGYRVAFGESVDRGTAVDWRGGRPWRATLADAVNPLGLTVSVAGPIVTIAAPTPSR